MLVIFPRNVYNGGNRLAGGELWKNLGLRKAILPRML